MANVAALGVGFPYLTSMPADFYQSGVVDFVEITLPGHLEQARVACRGLPTVVHRVDLSIGAAHGCNAAYLEMLDRFQADWPFVWHSEHLGSQAITGEAAERAAQRAAEIGKRYGVPFLLEHGVMAQSHCHQLLDLHNVYCNALNYRLDPFALIDRVALDRVVEIHIAGGSWRDGFWTDGHGARVPPPIWRLLEYTLRRTPNVAGVVFQVLDQSASRLGRDVIVEDLRRARAIWGRCHMARMYAAA